MIGRQKKRNETIEQNFGKNPMDANSFYNAENRLDKVARFHTSVVRNETGKYIDDITWEDLEMDNVYLRLNHTNSFIGEQMLYHKLHNLTDTLSKLDFENQEEHISYFDQRPDYRLEVEKKLQDIGKRDNAYYLAEFLLNSSLWKIGSTFVFHFLQVLLVVFALTSIFCDSEMYLIGLITIASINLLVYTSTKMKYEIYLESLAAFKQIYDFAKWVEKHEEGTTPFISSRERTAIQSLKKVSNIVLNFYGRKQNALSGDVVAILNDYIWGVTLLDVTLFNYTMKIIYNKQTDVLMLLKLVGEIDVSISILSYRKSINTWCVPDMISSGFQAEGLVHPLMKNPVANDFILSDRAIITGTNASGKSTFMKAIAINCILAQTIHTCSAKKVNLEKMYIMTCMSLRDDIMSGESYYFREAKYLKRILTEIEEEKVLCVIDEILKGTNTKERIAASKAILDFIGHQNCMVLVATHDNELTKNPLYEQFHFESSVVNNDMSFDYKIKDGVSTESNAIALLSVLNYPEEIVKRAKENMK